MAKKLYFCFFMVGAMSMFVMSSHYFQYEISGILRMKSIAPQLWYQVMFRAHIFFGIVAISTGPIQFFKDLQSRYPRFHRTLGYIYVCSVLTSSTCGLLIAPYAMGGWITKLGFSMLALYWFIATLMAVIKIKNGHVYNHQRWMFISYGITFSAITQRTLLLIPLTTTVPFMPIYQLSAWLPWMVNTWIALSLFKKLNPQFKPILK